MSSIADTVNAANQKQTLRVNPLDYPSVVCPDCGTKVFIPAAVFKKVPGLLLGNGGEEQIIPIQVYICAKCHKLMPEFEQLEKEPEPKNTESGIIL